MIELKILSNNYITNILINNKNNILYSNKLKVMEFIKLFNDSQNKQIQVYLSNKLINIKDFIFINLIDIQSIMDFLKYDKQSFLYEYINAFINNQSTISEDKLENILNKYIENLIKESELNISYEIEIDIHKILNNNTKLKYNYCIKDINNIVNMILKKIILLNANKTFIVFLDNELIDIKIKSNNLYIFSINNYIDKYNLIFTDEYNNLDYDILYDTIMKNYPVNYNEKLLKFKINEYLKIYFNKKIINTCDIDIKYISEIISTAYNIKQKCFLFKNDNNNLNQIEIL